VSDHAVSMLIDFGKWCFWFAACAFVILLTNGFFDREN